MSNCIMQNKFSRRLKNNALPSTQKPTDKQSAKTSAQPNPLGTPCPVTAHAAKLDQNRERTFQRPSRNSADDFFDCLLNDDSDAPHDDARNYQSPTGDVDVFFDDDGTPSVHFVQD